MAAQSPAIRQSVPVSDVGDLLKHARESKVLSQRELSEQSGVSESMISRVEGGSRSPSFDLAGQLLAAMGWQLRVELEPLDADVDRLIEAAAGHPMDQRLRTAAVVLPDLIAALDAANVNHVVEGASAALLQGAPVPVDALEIAVLSSDLEALGTMLTRNFAKRWDPRWRGWGYISADPREEGPFRWQVSWFGEMRARLVDELPASVIVDVNGTACRTRPLMDVEVGDPEIARILARVRARLAAADSSR